MKRSPRMLDAGRVHSFRLRQTLSKNTTSKTTLCVLLWVCCHHGPSPPTTRTDGTMGGNCWSPGAVSVLGLIGVLFQIVLTLWLNPLLPPLRVCDANELDLFAGFCAVEPIPRGFGDQNAVT